MYIGWAIVEDFSLKHAANKRHHLTQVENDKRECTSFKKVPCKIPFTNVL